MKKEQVRVIPLEHLKLNEGQLDWLPKNPRQWSRDDVKRLARSMDEDADMMQDRPLLAVPCGKDFVVFAGNLRLTAARDLKWPGAPVVVYTPEDQIDRETIKRRAMKDNGSFGQWDFDELANNWDDLPLADWGVPAWEGQRAEQQQEENTAHEDDFDEDVDEIHVICKMGDIWQLGEHRLMCGDSISLEDVQKLMGGGGDKCPSDGPSV